ncbi:hypothetical protein D5018_15405 [Parashewanella curva]|uniref:Uncharacterized protein n=1 Tax=Parashewanella curva TaxID=2338552 RepID=A0A3L8PTP7_9GAMM|nr:hypothetical protein [Parashewanella curva]RLV58785.1 hypothetical protein D5018_15405 [Parashewanella curva]
MMNNALKQWRQFTLITICFLLTSTLNAAEKRIDYPLSSAIYQWYGFLDSQNLGKEKQAQYPNVDFQELKDAKVILGAHHLLSIVPVKQNSKTAEVEVELEFLPKVANSSEVYGYYLIQTLKLDKESGKVLSSKTVTNEKDDFTSKFRSASEPNLIKAFIYQWTQNLDNLSVNQPNSHIPWNKHFTANTKFKAEETSASSLASYFNLLANTKAKTSRRAIRNLNIKSISGTNQFQIDFEYQWSLLNQYDENELAQLGVTLVVSIKNGVVIVYEYKAKYLPPVTDLGAEIRC